MINTNQYIEALNSSWIFWFCVLTENMFLAGDNNGTIKQWKIEGENLILIYKKKKHDSIYTLINIGNDHFSSSSIDFIVCQKYNKTSSKIVDNNNFELIWSIKLFLV